MSNANEYPMQMGFQKSSRDRVINVDGELGNPSIHADSPKNITTTASAVVLGGGKRTLRITNIGSTDCYYGDSSVTSANGVPLFAAGESVVFKNCKDDFTVYFITASGTTELRVVEFGATT